MTLNEMKENVIHANGFEHPATVYFFACCEMDNDLLLIEIAYEFAMGWKDPDEVIDGWLA